MDQYKCYNCQNNSISKSEKIFPGLWKDKKCKICGADITHNKVGNIVFFALFENTFIIIMFYLGIFHIPWFLAIILMIGGFYILEIMRGLVVPLKKPDD